MRTLFKFVLITLLLAPLLCACGMKSTLYLPPPEEQEKPEKK